MKKYKKEMVWMFKSSVTVGLWVWLLPIMLFLGNVPFRFLLDNLTGEIEFFVESVLGYAVYIPAVLLGLILVTKN